MFAASSQSRFFLYTSPTDMRLGFDGLAGLVQQQLRADPLSGDVFIFINRARDRIKLQGLEPFAYLRDVLSRIATHPYKRLEELLAQNWRPAK